MTTDKHRNYPISVCIPTFNYAKYLPQTIESICCQSFRDFELLIIDDCSTDNTADLVSNYAAVDRRIRFLVNKSHLGMVENWNACLSEARGEYIKFVFADDRLLSENALLRMMTEFSSCPQASLVFSARRVIDSECRELRLESPFARDLTADGLDLIRLCVSRQDNLIGEPTSVMFRKACAVRGFRQEYRQIVDQELWFHILEKGRFAYIHEPLVAFRSHPLQQSIYNRSRPLENLEELAKINEEYLGKQYMRISRFLRTYLQWDLSYRLWQLHATNQIDRATAIREIDRRYGYRKFAWFYPLYKTVKPGVKLYRALRSAEKCL
jgi:glycosyltransferase involved in cell wall biosynthesis